MSWKLGFFARALQSYAPPADSENHAGNSTAASPGDSPGTRLLSDTLQRLAA